MTKHPFISVSLCLPLVFTPVLAAQNDIAQEKNSADTSVTTLDETTVTSSVLAADKDIETREVQFNRAWSRESIDPQTIEEEGVNDVTEAIADVSGVTINSQGAFSKSITIRGLDGPRVSTVVDDVRIANQGMTHSGAGEINMTDLDAVSSIEVIKGGPSVVYDPGASGGIVKVNTLNAPVEKGFHGKQKFSYDQGYDKQQSTTILSGGIGKAGALVVYSKENADDYKVAGQSKDTELLVNQYQLNQEMSISPKTLKDLGYEAESLTLRGRADLGNETFLDVGFDRWVGKDIVSIHGNTTDSTASIFQTERMERDRSTISLNDAKFKKLENIDIKLADQEIFRRGSSDTTLKSQSAKVSFDLPFNKVKFSAGAEVVFDKAETLVYSEQDYIGAFANAEYETTDWVFNAGIRGNQWKTRQKLLDGTNPVVAEQLLGISGVTPEKEVSEPTWSAGAVYKLNEKQNIGLNLSSTFRNPDLYERYAFGDGFIGGGLDMKAESGKHLELSWKHLSDDLSISASLFHSKFDSFINTKTIRQITDAEGLNQCIEIGKCDPANGDYNNREGDFFTQYVKYYNAEDVNNTGAEISARLEKDSSTTKVGVSYNNFRSDDTYVFAHANPVKLNASHKHNFNRKFEPWVRVKGEYVFDYPEVKQAGGFSPYFKADLHAGAKFKSVSVNAGINNVFNETYRAPYNGINALERSVFINTSYEW